MDQGTSSQPQEPPTIPPDTSNHITTVHKNKLTLPASPAQKHYWTWLILKAHGRNNGGTVNLTSANPRDPPDITFHSFGEGSPSPTAAAEDAEKDLQAVLEGIRYAESVYADLLPLDGNFTRVWPPPEEVASDGEYTQWARDEAWGHHASSSVSHVPN